MPRRASDPEIANLIASLKRTADLVQRIDHKLDNHTERIVAIETKLNMQCKACDEHKAEELNKFVRLGTKLDDLSKEVWMQAGFWGGTSAIIAILVKFVITGS